MPRIAEQAILSCMDELVIDNLVYIPSKRAAEITGYAKDYVGQLCREGRIEAKLVGRSWYVLESSIREHRFGPGGGKEEPAKPPQAYEESEKTEIPSEGEQIQAEEPLSTWTPASYTPEPLERVLEIERPTYLTNTAQEIEEKDTNAPSQIEEVQQAWQEWFSKNEKPSVDTESVIHELSDDFTSIHEVAEEEKAQHEEKLEIPVKKSHGFPGSMDIQMEFPRAKSRKADGRVLKEKRIRKHSSSGPANIILQAVCVGIIIITIAVTIIGTGSLDAVSPNWSERTPVIDYLAGVRSVEK